MHMTQCLLVCKSSLITEETAVAGFLQVYVLSLSVCQAWEHTTHKQAFPVAIASRRHLPMGIPSCLQSAHLMMLPWPQKQYFQGLFPLPGCLFNDTFKKLVILEALLSAKKLDWSGSVGLWRKMTQVQKGTCSWEQRASVAGMGTGGWCWNKASPPLSIIQKDVRGSRQLKGGFQKWCSSWYIWLMVVLNGV